MLVFCSTKGGLRLSSSADLESGQAADRIAQALRQRLTQGLIPPGTPMRDGVLAREFEVSRNTMREALRRLESEGLLAHQMHKGVSVRRMDVADVRDAFTVRRAVEIRAIEESALVDQRQLDALLEPIAAGRLPPWTALGAWSARAASNFTSALWGCSRAPPWMTSSPSW